MREFRVVWKFFGRLQNSITLNIALKNLEK